MRIYEMTAGGSIVQEKEWRLVQKKQQLQIDSILANQAEILRMLKEMKKEN